MTLSFDRLHELADPHHQDNQFTIHPAAAMPSEFVLHRRWYVDPQNRNKYQTFFPHHYRQVTLAGTLLVVEHITGERILYNLPHNGDCFAHINVLRQSWGQASKQFHVTVYIPKSVTGNNFTYSVTDGVYFEAFAYRKGRWSCRVQNPSRHGPSTLACSRKYANAFCAYLSRLIVPKQGGGNGSAKVIRKISPKHTATTKMAERINQKLPFGALVHIVRRTFVAPATFLPGKVTHWSYPDESTGPQLVTGEVCGFRSHSSLPLAADITDDVNDDLQFALGKTADHVSLNINVNKRAWTESGCFEVVGYEPGVYKRKLLYDNYASLTCQLCWGQGVNLRQNTKFGKGGTHVSKSTLMKCAEVFIEFLRLELH